MTLCSSVKQIKAPYLFDWEQGIALHAMQGIGPHFSATGKFHGFSLTAAGTWGTFSSYGRGSHYQLLFFSGKSGVPSS